MSYVIEGRDAIEHWRVASAISMLRIETRTGMKAARYSLVKACETNWGCPKKTKVGALAWMEEYYERTYGIPYAPETRI